MKLYIYRNDERTEERDLFRSFDNVNRNESIRLVGMASNTPYYAVITDDEDTPLEHTTTMDSEDYDSDMFMTKQVNDHDTGTFQKGWRLVLTDDDPYFYLLHDETPVDPTDQNYIFGLFMCDTLNGRFTPVIEENPYSVVIEYLNGQVASGQWYYIVAGDIKSAELAISEAKQKL